MQGKLPSGRSLDVAKASAKAILAAAREIRQAHAGKQPVRGRTTTAAERATLRTIEERVKREKGLAGVSMKLVAMGAKKGADVLVRVPLASLVQMARVVADIKNR